MKNKLKILYPLLGLILLFSACTPNNYELGTLANKSTLKFTVAPSSTNPNNIVLTSLTPNVTPLWVTPVGRSIRVKDTVNVAFPGVYTFKYGVESAGGYVEADSVQLTITTLDQNALKDSMWINLTGGYGKSKTWVLDLDANGVSKYFSCPFYFKYTNSDGSIGEWDPAFKDISWSGVSAGDYGTMTFDLIGNANFKSDNKMFPELSGTGKFMLFPSTKQFQTTGAQVLHDRAEGDKVASWNAKMTIKSLDANHMQLIATEDSKDWLIYNYISKEYYDSH